MGKKKEVYWFSALLLAAAIGWGGAPWAGEAKPGPAGSKNLIPVKILRLLLDPTSQQPVVLLADLADERAMPIWIGPCEANALQGEIQGTKSPRPLTHDLADTLIRNLKGKIRRVIITHRQGGIYLAKIELEREGSLLEIDARPSDSLVLALKAKAPIFVSPDLFQEGALPLKEKKETEGAYGLLLQELTPPLAQSFSFPSTEGALVADVKPGSRAEKDGLRRGDILAEVSGRKVGGLGSLRQALAGMKAPMEARVFRQGAFISITLHPP